ncbi:NmrA-like family-domain-containing protein [Aspergillus karnatakaensis]|uniref:NmrA-like family-domain-containing protein n=1 Tax=Aspergillus karnatakaensis TaxID=1810916 RepID=UPI003CCE44FC
MPFNSIAVYGHRGWASSAIVAALIASGAPIKVLHRPGSDLSSLPESVARDAVAVDLDSEDPANQAAVILALRNVDIVISLVGHEGVTRQHGLIRAIPHTDVKLFVPSDLAARYDATGLRIPMNKAKDEVERAARKLGIPMAIVLPGNFAEFALATPAMGVDRRNNKILFTGDSEHNPLNLCTRTYVASAYVSLFATTPISALTDRTIALCELRPIGHEVADALTLAHGTPPRTAVQSAQSVKEEIETGLAAGDRMTLAAYCRSIWGSGEQVQMVGYDFWDVPGYEKADVKGLLGKRKLGEYRELPAEVWEGWERCFERFVSVG